MSPTIQAIFNYVYETKEIAAVLLTASLSFIGFFLSRIFAAKPKLDFAILHSSHLLPKENDGNTYSVYTMRASFINSGRKICEGVEFSLNFAPQHLEVFPHFPYKTHVNPDGRVIYTIEILNAQETITIAMMNIAQQLPEVTSVRFRGGKVRHINVELQRKYSAKFNWLVAFLILMGASSIVYILIRFLQTIL